MPAAPDRILPLTKIVAAIVVPFLVLAFLILYLTPDLSGDRFAWAIQPKLTAMYMGAGYLGGAWFFIQVIRGHKWHKVAAGFPGVTTFATAMLLATLLHWDRFDINHFPFVLWLVLYIVTPFLVPLVWWRNRSVASEMIAADELLVPAPARWGMLLLALLLLISAIVGFINPGRLITLWPWQLTPLTARVMSGWLALQGASGITIARDKRWSAWAVGLQSIGLWQLLVLVAVFANADTFRDGLVNWFVISVVIVVAAMATLYGIMARRQERYLLLSS